MSAFLNSLFSMAKPAVLRVYPLGATRVQDVLGFLVLFHVNGST